MPLTNWPPSSYPAWPPPEITEASSLLELARFLQSRGYTVDQPTNPERNQFFPNSVRCDENHQVNGRMLVSPDGTTRWPFAVCVNPAHKQALVLWRPEHGLENLSGDGV